MSRLLYFVLLGLAGVAAVLVIFGAPVWLLIPAWLTAILTGVAVRR